MDVVQSQGGGAGNLIMNPAIDAVAITREENLLGLGEFCRDLYEAYCEAGFDPAKAPEAWRRTITAKCLDCGMHVSGDELLVLAMLAEDQPARGKPGRLRRGYCPRICCEGWTYCIEFRPAEGVDWSKVFSQAQAARVRRPWRPWVGLPPFWSFPWVQRTAAVVALFLVFVVALEWYIGGRIPVLREPEKFQVDLVPQRNSATCTPMQDWRN
jgi:hypothetical protein